MFMRIQVIHAIFHISRTFRTIAELQVRIVLLGTSANRAFVAGQGNFLVYSFLTGGIIAKIEIVVSMLNFIIFFLMTRNYRKISPKEAVRKQKFKNEMQKAQIQPI